MRGYWILKQRRLRRLCLRTMITRIANLGRKKGDVNVDEGLTDAGGLVP